ncbi:PGPGW domain-containing protein [Saccharopolyspora sp. CA-218241]|uniref:PGPGW domain-containing protein n=1 Tax=Saccharopolyspora sp. CA-218241 TaxID=3240027 RepID=UPI003D998836
MPQENPLRRVVLTVVGSVLVLAGVALLVLPGPGLLLVLAGLITLAETFPALERYIEPVRRRALKAAEDSVATPPRIAGSVLAGLALIGAGIVWGVVPQVPLAGWSTCASLILSGLALLGLLYYSHRRVRAASKGRAR